MTGTRPTDNWQAAVDRVKATGKGWEALLYHAARLMRAGNPLPPALAEFIAGGLDGMRETPPKSITKLFAGRKAPTQLKNHSKPLLRAVEVEIVKRLVGFSQIRAAEALSEDHYRKTGQMVDPSTWVRAHDDHKQDACAIIATGKPDGPEPRPIDWITDAEQKAMAIARRMQD